MASPIIGGRVVIAARAYERIAAAAAADALGVDRGDASAKVRDDRGRLHAEISSAISRGDEPILARAERARRETSQRLHDLTGATVADVTLGIHRSIDTGRRTT